MNWLYKKRTLSFLTMLFFVVTGTYNAIVINSESHLNGADIRFVKRLDELYGVTEPGRLVATGIQWQKLTPVQTVSQNALQVPVNQVVNTIASGSSAPSSVPQPDAPAAAVNEELNLSLVEVVNPKKWKDGLPAGQFSGSLSTSNGTIDTLSVALPNGEGVTVSFSEMNGNVFEYDIDGEVYTGMLYQVDQTAYMVTLTNGPLEGTRLRFVGEPSQEQVTANDVAQTGNGESDNFGNPGEQPEQPAQTAQAEEAQPDVAAPPAEQMANLQQPADIVPSPEWAQEQAAGDPDAAFQAQGAAEFQPPT